MASTYLSKTLGTATNRKKFTVSFWFKRASLSSTQIVFAGTNGSADEFIYLNGSDGINAECAGGQLVSNMKLRDTNGWYHLVYTFDSAQATAGDRSALYINGTEISYSTETQPNQNTDPSYINNANLHTIGKRGSANDAYFGGLISHFHFCDGQAYAPSDFGETDSTTGEWKIKTSPSVTYGNNGFFILKDGNSVTDQSGNSNNFTVSGGTLTNTEDCPSNVFATLNPLSQTGNFTLSGSELPTNGNTVFTGKSSTNYPGFFSTLAASAGKYYAEFKVTSAAQGDSMIGVSNGLWNNVALGGSAGSYGSQDYVYFGYNGNIYTSGSGSAYGSAISLNDIVQIALDCDNNAMYVGVNGTYKNSGVPTSGASKTGAVSLPTSTTGVWHFAVGDYGTDGVPVINCNFGNGFFGTTAISSEGTNASGIGKFEYDVPAGYTALSTKGLNE